MLSEKHLKTLPNEVYFGWYYKTGTLYYCDDKIQSENVTGLIGYRNAVMPIVNVPIVNNDIETAVKSLLYKISLPSVNILSKEDNNGNN